MSNDRPLKWHSRSDLNKLYRDAESNQDQNTIKKIRNEWNLREKSNEKLNVSRANKVKIN